MTEVLTQRQQRKLMKNLSFGVFAFFLMWSWTSSLASTKSLCNSESPSDFQLPNGRYGVLIYTTNGGGYQIYPPYTQMKVDLLTTTLKQSLSNSTCFESSEPPLSNDSLKLFSGYLKQCHSTDAHVRYNSSIDSLEVRLTPNEPLLSISRCSWQ